MKKDKIRNLAILSMLIAIEIILTVTNLGSLPIGPGIVATLAHIPAIVAALVLGKRDGVIIGGVFAICSIIWWSTTGVAQPAAFAFTPFAQNGNFLSAVVCILPRLLFPLITALMFGFLKKKLHIIPAAVIAAITGSLFHSLFLLSLVYIFFSQNSAVAENLGKNYVSFIIAWAGLNALFEIILAGVIGGAIIVPLKRFDKTA